ncbi:MAG: hypothetical protein KIH69_009840 [Anaerolineae bacterium]|nr:hypothetical protein [Anaerolineae bacterium]
MKKLLVGIVSGLLIVGGGLWLINRQNISTIPLIPLSDVRINEQLSNPGKDDEMIAKTIENRLKEMGLVYKGIRTKIQTDPLITYTCWIIKLRMPVKNAENELQVTWDRILAGHAIVNLRREGISIPCWGFDAVDDADKSLNYIGYGYENLSIIRPRVITPTLDLSPGIVKQQLKDTLTLALMGREVMDIKVRELNPTRAEGKVVEVTVLSSREDVLSGKHYKAIIGFTDGILKLNAYNKLDIAIGRLIFKDAQGAILYQYLPNFDQNQLNTSQSPIEGAITQQSNTSRLSIPSLNSPLPLPTSPIKRP